MTVTNLSLDPGDTFSLRQALARPGVVAVNAPPAQIQPYLTSLLITLTQEGERVAVVIANNEFDLYAVARAAKRRGLYPELVLAQLTVARAETVYQVRRCIQKLVAAPQQVSVLLVFGLLEAFFDQAIPWQEAQRVLADTLVALKTLGTQNVRVLVTVTPADDRERAFLGRQLSGGVDAYVQIAPLPLERPKQRRLI